jgi:hypothetical protein
MDGSSAKSSVGWHLEVRRRNEDNRMGRESTGFELVQESEGGRAVLRFGSIRVREGGC